MAAVQQRVLNWLYSVLTSEYHDVNRTYNDVAQALSQYSSISPRTDVFTFENGVSALLLHLSGTIAANFRGTTYRFPISIWVPHSYPREPPMIYVTPTEGMVVRAGQHVDPQGKVYHPYLARWVEFSDKSNILDFLAVLRDVFSKEPPVVARPSVSSPAPPPQQQTPPSLPPLPNKPRDSPGQSSNEGRPPPPPPKHPAIASSISASPGTITPNPHGGPPLPPLPHQMNRPPSQYDTRTQQSPQPVGQPSHTPQTSSALRYESVPPLPTQVPAQVQVRQQSLPSMSGIVRESFPGHQYQTPPPRQYMTSPSNQQALSEGPPSGYPPPNQQYYGQPPPWSQSRTPQQTQLPTPQQKPAPPPDLIDAPLTLTIPTMDTSNVPAPPIPPNPEKDLLLRSLAKALYDQRQATKAQNESSIPGLQAQRSAMLASLNAMNMELSSLESLSAMLTSNTNILHAALRDADKTIETSAHRTPPAIDELLVAPTVVGNQLYELVSEERALGDALFVLGRAVQKGRVQPAVFAKTTRALAREWYLKKALVKKIGKGMGLST